MAVSFEKEFFFTKDDKYFLVYDNQFDSKFSFHFSNQSVQLLALLMKHKDTPKDIQEEARKCLSTLTSHSERVHYYTGQDVSKFVNCTCEYLNDVKPQDIYLNKIIAKEFVQQIPGIDSDELMDTTSLGIRSHFNYADKLWAINDSVRALKEVAKEKSSFKMLACSDILFRFTPGYKFPVKRPVSELKDDTQKILYDKVEQHKKLIQTTDSFERVVKWLKNNPTHLNQVTPRSLGLTLHTYKVNAKATQLTKWLSDNKELANNFFIQPQLLIQELESINAHLVKISQQLQQSTVNYDDYIKKRWTGSMEDESAFDTGRSFYIIASDSSGDKQGFVGLKSVYNRGNSNCYTYSIVRDIKNAILFTDGAQYELGYGINETERLYVAMKFEYLNERKSKLAQKVGSYIEKNRLTKSLAGDGREGASADISSKDKTTQDAVIKAEGEILKVKKHKI